MNIYRDGSTVKPPVAEDLHVSPLLRFHTINFSHVNINFIKVILFQLDAVARGETLRKR